MHANPSEAGADMRSKRQLIDEAIKRSANQERNSSSKFLCMCVHGWIIYVVCGFISTV